MSRAGLDAGIDRDGATAGDGAYPRGKQVIGICVGSEIEPEDAGVIEINPNRAIKRNRIRGIAVGNNLHRVSAALAVEDGRRNVTFRAYNSVILHAGAAPVVSPAIINIATAVGEAHQRVVAVHLGVVTVGSALG